MFPILNQFLYEPPAAVAVVVIDVGVYLVFVCASEPVLRLLNSAFVLWSALYVNEISYCTMKKYGHSNISIKDIKK